MAKNVLIFTVLVLFCTGSRAQLETVNKFLSNLGHGIKSVFTGRPVTLSGSTGPSKPPGHSSKDPRDIKFFLFYDKENLDDSLELFIENASTLPSPSTFNGDKPLKILIHGFNRNSSGKRFPVALKNAYLECTESNIILMDWGNLATAPNTGRRQVALFYPVVAKKTKSVGEHLAKFILFLKDEKRIKNFGQVHLIGFSLGAHVAGFAGAYLKKKGIEENLGRITGLDPAGPLFTQVGDEGRLDRTDADFVDVVHSSIFGLYEDIGHVDFYPNGGKYQENCQNKKKNPISSFTNYFTGLSTSKCGHYRASQYFTRSVKQEGTCGVEANGGSEAEGAKEVILACKSNSWEEFLANYRATCEEQIKFGEYCPKTARGKYFLEINL